MINEILGKIRDRILDIVEKKEMDDSFQDVIDTLEKELEVLADTHHPHAVGLAGLTKISVHETLSEKPSKDMITTTNKSIADLARYFEATHPDLVDAMDAFLLALVRLGV